MLEVFLKKKKESLKIVGLFCVLLLLAIIFLLWRPEKPVLPENQAEEIKVFSLAGLITSVDGENSFIMVRDPAEDKDIKAIISDDSEIVRFEFPAGEINSAEDQIFSPKTVKISINDLKPGDQVFIESRENIYKRSEFDSIKRIQVMP